MSCDLMRPLISAYRDGELEDADVPRVMEHLDSCGACAAELEALDGVAKLLAEDVPHAVPRAVGRLRRGAPAGLG